MLFSSNTFLLYFLPLLVFLYFLVPKKRLPVRNLVLLAFSLVFYAYGGVRYLFLLLISILVNYLGGLGVGLPKGKGLRRLFLVLTLTVNLGLLGYFKYAGFFSQILADLGFGVKVLKVVLPIGISFFTFQGASYVIDVYRGDTGIQKNPLNVALYVSLFPQLVAGPIVRYRTIEGEITRRETGILDFSDGLTRFLFGFGKKMLLANPMGTVADGVFAQVGSDLFSTPLSWLGAVAYTLQIYFDFSAYSDMAIGLGRMFGFHFLENFNYPYVAGSVTEFWRRWHISLSTWFRDYVYIPLGGNRRGKARQIFNLMVVWALTGLWHGANWTFIFWGLYYGVLLILEKFVLAKALSKVPALLRHLITLGIVTVGWVIFRSDSLALALRYLGTMFDGSSWRADQTVFYLAVYWPEFLLCAICCLPIKPALQKFLDRKKETSALAYYTAGLFPKLTAAAVFFLGYLKLVTGSYNPFIYFQF